MCSFLSESNIRYTHVNIRVVNPINNVILEVTATSAGLSSSQRLPDSK